MERIAPKPPLETEGLVIKAKVEPRHLMAEVSDAGSLFVLAHLGVPRVDANDWSFNVRGLVKRELTLSLSDLMSYPQASVESFHECAGNPLDPTTPLRVISNVVWRGVDVRHLLDVAGIDSSATHLWAYGLDYGEFAGSRVTHYVKDVPLSRVEQGDVLIAHALNGAPLSSEHGYPARLVVPGFYGTNSVKWLCRLELANSRPEGLFTTQLYNDPVEGGGTRPVWAVEPESIFVFPEPQAKLNAGANEIWGRAWSSAAIVAVDVSFDGGGSWQPAEVTPRRQRSWQRFSVRWHPPTAGTYRLQCRATNAAGRTQPSAGARNAIYSVDVVVEPL